MEYTEFELTVAYPKAIDNLARTYHMSLAEPTQRGLKILIKKTYMLNRACTEETGLPLLFGWEDMGLLFSLFYVPNQDTVRWELAFTMGALDVIAYGTYPEPLELFRKGAEVLKRGFRTDNQRLSPMNISQEIIKILKR